MSSAVEIRPHATKGRALYATKSYTPGATILPVTPLLLLPSLSHLSTTCSYCLVAGEPRACSRCQAAFYCNATCQSAAWSAVHSKECKPLQRIAAQGRPGLPTPVRALLQALVKPNIADGLRDLEGHAAMWRRTSNWKDMEMMAMGASAFAGKGTAQAEVQRALDLLCKIQTNAFHRYDADLGQVGIFLEPTLAMANHSCLPNAMVQFVGRQAILRTETPIKAGDEIQISYTDYTYPLSKRVEALSPYNFTCQCPRCVDDLTVYQACAALPDIVGWDDQTLLSSPQLRSHPAAQDPTKVSLARSFGERARELLDSKSTPEPLDERFASLKAQYVQCSELVSGRLWAISPLPQILTEIPIYYAEAGDFVSAATVACHVATMCDPYRYVAPFHPVRTKGLFMIARLLANTAADTAALGQSAQITASKKSVNQKALETLRGIDQVSLCQMLLIMVLWATPAGKEAEWELSASAKTMLDDIDQLPGRDQELSLINAWKNDPHSDQSKAFFDYAVVKQINALGDLGREVLKVDFGS